MRGESVTRCGVADKPRMWEVAQIPKSAILTKVPMAAALSGPWGLSGIWTVRYTPCGPGAVGRSGGSIMATRLFIGGLSWGTTDEGLTSAFARFGAVMDARVIYDRESGRSRGFGFVTYTDPDAARAAIDGMDGEELDGRAIRVDVAEERRRPGSASTASAPEIRRR